MIKLKNDKIRIIYKYIFCFINSLIGLFTIKFMHPINDIFGNKYEVYLKTFDYKDGVYFFLFFIIWLVIFYFIDYFIKKKKVGTKKIHISNRRLFFICMIIMLICWSPYYLTFFPGGVYSDTYVQYTQALNGSLGGGYPIFYTLFLKLLLWINMGNSSGVFALLTIIQLLLYSGIFAYLIIKLKEYNVSKKVIIITLLFYSLYPRIPIYALSLWKDSLFSIFLLLYVIKLYDILRIGEQYFFNKKNILIYILVSILVSLFRNNGLYIIIIINIILFIKYRRCFSKLRPFYIANISLIIILLIVYGPLFNNIGKKVPYSESIGISLQQISYVVSNEEDIDKKSLEFIDNLLPIKDIKENYFPMIVDSIKKHKAFNNDFLENNKDAYWEVYFKLFKDYPLDYFKAYLYTTVGFWNYYINCHYAGSDSLQDFYDVTLGKEYNDISNNHNILKEVFNIDLKDKISSLASRLNNCALGSLIAFIGIYILISKKKLNKLLLYIPSVLIFLALLFGTPIAFSSRYIIYTILFIPYSIIIPFIDE